MAMKRAGGFRISARARHDWEYFSVSMSIQDVVDALFALPADRIKDPEQPPARQDWRIVHARVEGVLFMMAGTVGPTGEWKTAEIVAPVWPPEHG